MCEKSKPTERFARYVDLRVREGAGERECRKLTIVQALMTALRVDDFAGEPDDPAVLRRAGAIEKHMAGGLASALGVA